MKGSTYVCASECESVVSGYNAANSTSMSWDQMNTAEQ